MYINISAKLGLKGERKKETKGKNTLKLKVTLYRLV
jgi:hypothetical protein